MSKNFSETFKITSPFQRGNSCVMLATDKVNSIAQRLIYTIYKCTLSVSPLKKGGGLANITFYKRTSIKQT